MHFYSDQNFKPLCWNIKPVFYCRMPKQNSVETPLGAIAE